MDRNIIERMIVPQNSPSTNIVQRDHYNLFAPMGGINKLGMVAYSDDFVMHGDTLSLRDRIRTSLTSAAFDLVMRAIDYNNSIFDPSAKWRDDVTVTFESDDTSISFVIYGKDSIVEDFGVIRYSSQLAITDGTVLSIRYEDSNYIIEKLVSHEESDHTYYDVQEVSYPVDDMTIERLHTVVLEGSIDAYKDYAVRRLPYNTSSITGTTYKVYGITVTGEGFVDATTGVKSYSIVTRNSDGQITVKPPVNVANPTTKSYVDAYYTELNNRLKSLETTGRIKTHTLGDKAKCIQVRDALKYGIFEKIGGNVYTIEVGRPFNFSAAYVYNRDNIVAVSDTLAILSANNKWGIRIPICSFTDSPMVQFFAKGNNIAGEGWGSILFYTINSSLSPNPNLGESIAIPSNAVEILVYKNPKSGGATLDIPLYGFEMRVAEEDLPKLAGVSLFDVRTIDLSTCYARASGDANASIDFQNNTITLADGTVETLSTISSIRDTMLNFELRPSDVIRFKNQSGEVVEADYVLHYMENVGG